MSAGYPRLRYRTAVEQSDTPRLPTLLAPDPDAGRLNLVATDTACRVL